MFDKLSRLVLSILVVASLSACANLEAVRNFTATSSKITGYTDVTQRYVSGPDRIQKEIPEGDRFDAVRQSTNSLKLTDDQKTSLLKLHSVVTGYMAALAKLAGDDALSISPQIDKVTGALVAAPSLGLNNEHVKIYGSIASKVSSWLLAALQAKEVKSMVNEYGPSMDTMLEALELVTSAMKVQLENERGQLKTFHDDYLSAFLTPLRAEQPASSGLSEQAKVDYEKDREIMLSRRRAEIAWANRGYSSIQSSEDAAVSSAVAVIDGIRIVRKGHADMQKKIDRLTSEEVKNLLKKATDDLVSINDNLKKL